MKFQIEIPSTQTYTQVMRSHGEGWKSTESQGYKVLETGLKGILLDQIAYAITHAEAVICVQSFLMDDNVLFKALKAAADRGVRVYVMGSAEARLKDQNEEEEDWRKAAYIDLLEKTFKERFVFRQAENLHAKYIVIDPMGAHPMGFLCTNNFTGHAFTHNPELGVVLSKTQIQELYRVFVYHFWEHTTDMQTQRKEFDKVNSAGIYAPPALKELLLTSPNQAACNLSKTLLALLNQAKKSISVAAFGFDAKHPFCKALLDKAKAGVEVNIYMPPREKLLAFADEASTVGAKVLLEPRVHAKFILVDDNKGAIFTANFEPRGLDTGMEVGVQLDPAQTADLSKIISRWQADCKYVFVPKVGIQQVQTEIFKLDQTGKPSQIRIETIEKKSYSLDVKTVRELKTQVRQAREKRPSANYRQLLLEMDVKSKPLPKDIKKGASIIEQVIRFTWKNQPKDREQEGALFLSGFNIDQLEEIPGEVDGLPVFFEL